MTVQELIEHLQQFPEDYEVLVFDQDELRLHLLTNLDIDVVKDDKEVIFNV